jgi:hypothetical protein
MFVPSHTRDWIKKNNNQNKLIFFHRRGQDPNRPLMFKGPYGKYKKNFWKILSQRKCKITDVNRMLNFSDECIISYYSDFFLNFGKKKIRPVNNLT